MTTVEQELNRLVGIAKQYINEQKYEEAFVTLWHITQSNSVYNEAEGKIARKCPTRAPDPRHYKNYLDIEFLDNDNTYQNIPLNTLIDQSPLYGLWLLDRFLRSRTLPGRTSAQPVDVNVSGQEQVFWLVRKNPLRVLDIKAVKKCADTWRFHPGHGVIPQFVKGTEIKIETLESTTADRLAEHVSVDHLRIHYSHFADTSRLESAYKAPSATGLLYSGIDKEEERKAKIIASLDEALHKGAHIVVFPELTVTPALHRCIVDWLAANEAEAHTISWIVAGSFHEPCTDNPKKWMNRSYSFGYYGNEIHKHTKITKYGEAKSGYEDIKTWRDVWLVETPIGLFATPICLDYCNADNKSPAAGTFSNLFVDLFLVPAMDEKDSAHKRQAIDLKRFGGSRSVVAIQHPKDNSRSLSFDSNDI